MLHRIHLRAHGDVRPKPERRYPISSAPAFGVFRLFPRIVLLGLATTMPPLT
jgi:hypothetical protein